jgi:phage terminase large subunit-like protein
MARTKKIPAKAIKFIESLSIPTGPNAGKKLKLAPFQRDFIRGALDPDVQYGALCVGRGGGKSALSAAIATGALLGEWDEQPDREILIAARTREQARVAWNYVRSFIKTLPEDIQDQITVRENPRLEIQFAGRGEGIIKAIAADGKNVLGTSPNLVLADEIGHWDEAKGGALFAALESGIGKRQGKMLLISTSASDDTHMFSQFLDEPPSKSFVMELRPEPNLPLDDVGSLKLANPGAEHGIGAPLDWLIEQAQRATKRGGSAAANFRLYNRNERTATDERELLLRVDEWLECETTKEELPPREGPCVIGIDLGGSASLSGVAYYWPETTRLEVLATAPSVPNLLDRGANDGVGDRYQQMYQRGELNVIGDRTVPVAPWLSQVLSHVEGEPIAALTMDRFKQAELGDAIDRVGIRVPLVWRGQGFRDGSADCNAFRRAAYDGKIKSIPSLLLRSALADAVVVRDKLNNISLTKLKSNSRIDAVSAAVLAVAQGQRLLSKPHRQARVAAWV